MTKNIPSKSSKPSNLPPNPSSTLLSSTSQAHLHNDRNSNHLNNTRIKPHSHSSKHDAIEAHQSLTIQQQQNTTTTMDNNNNTNITDNNNNTLPIVFDDSLSCQAMTFLLQQPTMDHTARLNLRRNLLQLQKSIDNDMKELKSLCCSVIPHNNNSIGASKHDKDTLLIMHKNHHHHHGSNNNKSHFHHKNNMNTNTTRNNTTTTSTTNNNKETEEEYLLNLYTTCDNGNSMLNQAIQNLATICKSSQYAAISLAVEIVMDLWELHCHTAQCHEYAAVEHAMHVEKKERSVLEAKIAELERRNKELESNRGYDNATPAQKQHSHSGNDDGDGDGIITANVDTTHSNNNNTTSSSPSSMHIASTTTNTTHNTGSNTTTTTTTVVSQDDSNNNKDMPLLHRIEQLQEEISRLQKALSSTTNELETTLQRTAALEQLVNQTNDIEESLHSTEQLLQAANDRMMTMTPRPSVGYLELHAVLGSQHADMTLNVLKSLKSDGSSIDGLVECLTSQQESRVDGGTSTSTVAAIPTTVVDNDTNNSNTPSPSIETINSTHTTTTINNNNNTLEQPLPPLQSSQLPSPPPFKGLLHGIITPTTLTSILHRCTGSTSSQYTAMEQHIATLHSENNSLKSQLEVHLEAERRREAAKRRREEEALLEKKNAIQQYLDLLSSQGEDAWKEQLIGMGQGADVPKIFRHAGKIRNKHLSKRDTEKLVKEIWKERLTDPAVVAGRAGELIDFVGSYLQKKVGIAAAVIELGYNFLYGLWLYQWDADCELFLRIVAGEIREEVYVAQCRLQSDLEELFALLDKSKGQTTGKIPKDDLRIALSSFFRVGQSGGKSPTRFDEAMQALDQDQPGPTIEWKKVFEEDREFNQGEFAESLRDQFLQERIEFFAALETALYEESGNNEECRRDQVIKAILMINPECTEKVAVVATSGVFLPGIDVMSVKAVMKKLSRGILRGAGSMGSSAERLSESTSSLGGSGRKSSAGRVRASQSASSSSPGTAAAAGLSGGKRQNEAIGRALEEVRRHWIKKQLESKDGV